MSFEFCAETELIGAFDRLTELCDKGQLALRTLPDGSKVHEVLADAVSSVCYNSGRSPGQEFLSKLSKIDVVHKLNDFRKDKKGPLGKLRVGKHEVPIHPFWLAARSSTAQSEFLKTQSNTLTLPDEFAAHVETVNQFVNFIYTGRLSLCDADLSIWTVVDLAKHFNVGSLLEKAVEWIKATLSEDTWLPRLEQLQYRKLTGDVIDVTNVAVSQLKGWLNDKNWFAIYLEARIKNLPQVIEPVLEFVAGSFKTLRNDESLLLLQMEHLKAILNSDALQSRNEDEVAELVLNWAKQSKSCRRQRIQQHLQNIRQSKILSKYFSSSDDTAVTDCLCEEGSSGGCTSDNAECGRHRQFCEFLLNVVRLQHVSLNFLKVRLLCEPLVLSDLQLTTRCRMAVQSIRSPCARQLFHSNFPPKRTYHSTYYAFGGEFSKRSIEKLQLTGDNGCWTKLPYQMLTPIEDCTAVAVGNDIFIPGGWNGGSLQDLLMLNVDTSSFRQGAQMIEKRHFHHTLLLNDEQIFVLGGKENNRILRSSEVYQIGSNTWAQLPEMQQPRHLGAAAVLSPTTLFIAGGHNGGGFMCSTESLDLHKQQWYTGPQMSDNRGRTHAATFDGRMYMLGGESDRSTVEALDVRMPHWVRLPDMTIGRHDMRLVSTGSGRLLVIGGKSGPARESTEFFEVRCNRWTPGPKLCDHRVSFGLAAV